MQSTIYMKFVFLNLMFYNENNINFQNLCVEFSYLFTFYLAAPDSGSVAEYKDGNVSFGGLSKI